jgi:hypothetical protein
MWRVVNTLRPLPPGRGIPQRRAQPPSHNQNAQGREKCRLASIERPNKDRDLKRLSSRKRIIHIHPNIGIAVNLVEAVSDAMRSSTNRRSDGSKHKSLNRSSADVESLLYREVAKMGKSMSQKFCALEFFLESLDDVVGSESGWFWRNPDNYG